jgi:hypothetical protein
MKNKQMVLAGGTLYCPDSVDFSVSAANRLLPEQVRDRLCNLTGLYIDSENFRNGNKNNPGNCYGQL